MAAAEVRGRWPRWTITLRLTLLYGGLHLLAGAALLGIVYLLVAHHLHWVGTARPDPHTVDVHGSLPALPDLSDALDDQRRTDLRRLVVASVLALAITTLLSVCTGWLMARRAMNPLRTVTAAAQDISAHDLHRRIALHGPRDEITDLADTFDDLLSRLDGAFRAQRSFVANASHELRTPLTLERSLLEVTLADPDATAAELRDCCERVLTGNQQQAQLIDALLVLAHGEQRTDERSTVDLAGIAADELRQRGAGPLEVRTGLATALVAADPALMTQLVRNLVDNAHKHNIPGGWISIDTDSTDTTSTLRVANTGPTVTTADLAVMFEPFQRLDTARVSPEHGGFGLGLSIVRAIAVAHDAVLTTEPLPAGGLDIRVTLPRAAA